MSGAEKPAPTSVLDASALLAVLPRENGADVQLIR
jgi:PIN domain nuclease of toxin-antitoxin system